MGHRGGAAAAAAPSAAAASTSAAARRPAARVCIQHVWVVTTLLWIATFAVDCYLCCGLLPLLWIATFAWGTGANAPLRGAMLPVHLRLFATSQATEVQQDRLGDRPCIIGTQCAALRHPLRVTQDRAAC